MICSACGAKVAEKDERCPGCGARFFDLNNLDFSDIRFVFKEDDRPAVTERSEG